MSPAALVRSLLDPQRTIPGERAEDRRLQRGLEDLAHRIELDRLQQDASTDIIQTLQGVASTSAAATDVGSSFASLAGEDDLTRCLKAVGDAGRRIEGLIELQVARAEDQSGQLAGLSDGLIAAARAAKKRA